MQVWHHERKVCIYVTDFQQAYEPLLDKIQALSLIKLTHLLEEYYMFGKVHQYQRFVSSWA